MADKMELVTIVVQRRDGKKAVDAAIKAGAPGATTFYARGTGVRQRMGLMGLFIEAEKEVVLIGLPAGKSDGILDAVNKAVGLDKPGKGYAFVQTIDRVIGSYQDRAEESAS